MTPNTEYVICGNQKMKQLSRPVYNVLLTTIPSNVKSRVHNLKDEIKDDKQQQPAYVVLAVQNNELMLLKK